MPPTPQRVAGRRRVTAPPAGRWRRCLQVTYQRIARHRQHIALTQAMEPATKPIRTPHLVIASDPPMREPRATGLQHVQRQLVPRAIPSVGVGHTSFVQAGFVRGPCFGQIPPHVDQSMARARHVAQVDGHLTVVDLTGPATPLACSPPTRSQTWESPRDRTPAHPRRVPSARRLVASTPGVRAHLPKGPSQ